MITEQEYKKALNSYPSLRKRFIYGEKIQSVECCIEGISGGKGRNRFTDKTYRLFIDLTNIKNEIPLVFFFDDDRYIRHVNIFPPAICSALNRKLPQLCWGNENKTKWLNMSYKERCLFSLLEEVSYVLKHQNFNSPARNVLN